MGQAHENILFSSYKRRPSSQQSQQIAEISGHGEEWNRVHVLALSSNKHKFGWEKKQMMVGSACVEALRNGACEMTSAERRYDFVRCAVPLRRCVCAGGCVGLVAVGVVGLSQRTDPIPTQFPSGVVLCSSPSHYQRH